MGKEDGPIGQVRKKNKTNTWREKARDLRSLKAAATKAYTKSEDNDDTRSVFSDITFTVVADTATA